MSNEERAAVSDILKYLQKQPHAKHTAKGIAKYWIFQQRVEEKVEVVLTAIEFLLHEGFLEEVAKSNGASYYKASDKIKDVSDLLKRLQTSDNH